MRRDFVAWIVYLVIGASLIAFAIVGAVLWHIAQTTVDESVRFINGILDAVRRKLERE